MGRPRGRRRVRVRGQPRGTSTQALSFRQGLLSLGGHRPSRPGGEKKPGREGGKEHRGSESPYAGSPVSGNTLLLGSSVNEREGRGCYAPARMLLLGVARALDRADVLRLHALLALGRLVGDLGALFKGP